MPERPLTMLSLTDVFEVSSALGDTGLDVDLRALLGFRAWHACLEHEAVLGADFQMFVIESGDYPDAINRALGMALTGDDADDIDFFSVEDHGLWLEAVILPEDGPHIRLFLRNDDGLEMGLHRRCLVALDGKDDEEEAG
jgi:hypothetical protein